MLREYHVYLSAQGTVGALEMLTDPFTVHEGFSWFFENGKRFQNSCFVSLT